MRLLLGTILVFHKVCSHTEIKPKKMALTYLLHMELPTQQVIDSKRLRKCFILANSLYDSQLSLFVHRLCACYV